MEHDETHEKAYRNTKLQSLCLKSQLKQKNSHLETVERKIQQKFKKKQTKNCSTDITTNMKHALEIDLVLTNEKNFQKTKMS